MKEVLILVTVWITIASFCPYPIPPWNCPNIPKPPPADNVRKLQPGNIKVVMSLGDSISAGFAMIGYLPENILEWRDYVFSIGGAKDAFTIPNMLKHYNPDLKGTAESWTWPLTKGQWLNGAVSSAKVENVPDQIDYLVNQLKTTYSKVVNYEEDWKLLTLFIGANNLCGACHDNSNTLPEFYEAHLKDVLQRIKDKIPRVFVNVVTLFNISGVWYAGQDYFYCEFVWKYIAKTECSCMQSGNKTLLDKMDARGVTFNGISEKLAQQFANLNNPNFTVVVQPGLTGIVIQKFGEDYLSNLDCFHPSLCANQVFSYIIWNNMFQPIGKKALFPDPNDIRLYCPKSGDYIQ